MDGEGHAADPLGAGRGRSKPRAAVDSGKLRMRDLTALTGLDRQTIHFYIQAGLLPEGDKTGRNKALYDRATVQRIELIRKLQKEQFMPLRAIRAVLDGDEEAFAPEQRRFLLDVKALLRAHGVQSNNEPARKGAARAEEWVEIEPLLRDHGVARIDFDEMVEHGLIEVRREKRPLIRKRDAFRIELLGSIRKAGLVREFGFVASDLRIIEDAIDQLFQRERDLVVGRLHHLEPAVIAPIFERVLPLVGELLHRLHTARVEAFFESLGNVEPPPPAPKSRASKTQERTGKGRTKHAQ